MAADVVVRFLADTKQLQSEISNVEGTGSRIKTWAVGISAAIGTAFAVKAVKDFISAAEESDAAAAKLHQTLKLAGDESGKWADHALKLAGTLQKQTGISDEVIAGGQAILSTFHEVSNATAQQNGMFDRATKAAVDLSATGFGSVDTASTMLGKALQDPVAGMTALRRAGVTFTAEQQASIKAMVDTNQSAAAQAAILAEVERQVGGTAAASATASSKMKASWGETQEALGRALLPVLAAIAPILQKIAGFVQDNATWLVPLAATILSVVAALKVWTIVQTALDIVLNANPIGAIVLAIAALIAIIVLAIKHWDDIKAAAVAAMDLILGAVTAVWDWIQNNWPLLLAILFGPFGIAVKLIIDNWDDILNFFRDLPGKIAGFLSGVFDIITTPYVQAFNFVKGIWNDFARGWNNLHLTLPEIDTHIPGVGKIGGERIDFPNLPTLARGGIVTGPTLALIGEAGPEAVIPLGRGTGGGVINLTVNVDATASPADVGRAIVDAIRSYERVATASWRAS
jgi:hypothetical protein